MNVSELCPDDLLLAARQGALSMVDDAKLEFHLQRCARCRATLEVGRAFDAVLGARAGDDRIANALGARMTERRSKYRLAFVALVGVLLSGSLAGAAVSGVDFGRFFGSTRDSTTRGAKLQVTPQPRGALAPSPASAMEVVQPPNQAVPAPEMAPIPAEPARLPLPPSSSAAELFREANELRRAGRVAEAQKRYGDLQSRFPGSTEARVSLVSVARLELASSPAAALRHFDAYLAQSVHRTLAEEAMFGRASALGRLGQKTAERAAWQELLARFPASVYAQQAQARLSKSP